MFDRIKKACKTLVVAGIAVVSTVVASFAAMSPADEALVKSGLTASDTVFYSIGGAILVVLAGIWGFRKVMGLISSK